MPEKESIRAPPELKFHKDFYKIIIAYVILLGGIIAEREPINKLANSPHAFFVLLVLVLAAASIHIYSALKTG